jgi:hypothetical protein
MKKSRESPQSWRMVGEDRGRSSDVNTLSAFASSVNTRQTLQLAYGAFLARFQWDVFATGTYGPTRSTQDGRRIEVHTGIESTYRHFQSWLRDWYTQEASERGTGDEFQRRYKRGKRDAVGAYVVALEVQRRGQWHWHALLQFPESLGELFRSTGWKLWKERFGFARVEPPTRIGGVAGYVAKYVSKDGGRDGEMFLSPKLSTELRGPLAGPQTSSGTQLWLGVPAGRRHTA